MSGFFSEENRRARQDRVTRIDDELRGLISDLAGIGIKVKSIGEENLCDHSSFAAAVSIILAHLQRPYSDVPKSVIAGELLHKHAAIERAWPQIVDLYRIAPNTAVPFRDVVSQEVQSKEKLVLANVLLKAYQPKRLSEMLALIRDPDNGETRIILLESLSRIRKRPEINEILLNLKSDPELKTEISAWGV